MTQFYYNSPLGTLHIVCDCTALREIHFTNSFDIAQNSPKDSIATSVKLWLDLYFSGKIPDFMPPLEPIGSEFRHRVWSIISKIPYGKTMTYGEIADIIATERGILRMSAQAVGGAVGANPIPIIIPCHRVIGTNGKLVGYSDGLDKKISLLKLEGIL